MKLFNIFFIALFIFSAALQYNDPDPFVWIAIYLYGAVLCYLAIKEKYKPVLYIAGLTIYLAYAIYLFGDPQGVQSWWLDHNGESIVQSMKAEKPWIEETREFFGLMILVVVLVINMIWLSKLKRAKAGN